MVHSLQRDLNGSDVYSRDCDMDEAWRIIDSLQHRLTDMENQAQDLFELQELLEESIVNFSILPQLVNLHISIYDQVSL